MPSGRCARLTDFDVVVVDEPPPAELVEVLRSAGTELVVAPPVGDGGSGAA